MSTESVESTTSFANLDLRPELLEALTELGYTEPTPIQAASIPTLIKGNDVLAQAATGTGKTAAFALPILQQLEDGDRGRDPSALVLVPTRELAIQVSEAMHKYGEALGARVVAVYGGQPIDRQLRVLQKGVDIVVATPGRAIDHLKRKSVKFSSLKVVVLDEADEMLDMGFAEELDQILTATPESRQTALFSATMPNRIEHIARTHLRNPERITIARPKAEAGVAPLVRQTAYLVSRNHKAAAIGRIIDVEQPAAAIVFCRTRAEVDTLTATLNGRGYRAEALHGGMDQIQRDRVMNRVRKSTTNLLIATDVAARGLDIDQMTHVFNYDVPSGPETYTHRIGRVGRAGREGVAITLTEPKENRMLKTIERVTKLPIEVRKLPSVDDLKAARMAKVTEQLQTILTDEKKKHLEFRSVVDALADDYATTDIALAALLLARQASGAAIDENEIPEVTPFDKGKNNGPRSGRYDKPERGPRNDRFGGDKGSFKKGPRRSSAGMGKLFLSVGRNAQVRPQDLVGAIAGETQLSGRDIGAIDISDRFSIVEVPEASINDVIKAMRMTTIKGLKATVRRDKGPR